MHLTHIPLAEQSRGGFDNGRIVEHRPVVPENTGVAGSRFGQLFYWAWAVSDGGGYIAEHPHRGYEIASYVLEGRIEHRDSLGTWNALDAGGLQVMQTNSGVSHSERFAEGMHTEMFQIWFEPDLQETLRLPPSYADYPPSVFSWQNAGGNRVKHVMGADSPAPLRTDAHFHDIVLKPRGFLKLTKNDTHAVIVAISGAGDIVAGTETCTLNKGDAAVVTLGVGESFRVVAHDGEFRYAQILSSKSKV